MEQKEVKPWLVQRLMAPWEIKKGTLGALFGGNPFSFGGGVKNGGLTDEAMKLLTPLMSFDYMGAAEFEFGALPKSLQRLAEKAKKNELICGTTLKDNPMPTYYICFKENEDSVLDFLSAASVKEPRLKERTEYPAQLKDFHADRAIGWIVVDENSYGCPPFMWFLSKEMFEGVANIFGLGVDKTLKSS
jgi:hypothetical protein